MRLVEFRSGALGTWLARVARRYVGPFLIGTVVFIAGLLLYVLTYMLPSTATAFKLFKDIEARTLDVRFRVRGPKKPDPAIVIVAIDEKSEDLLGRFPFPRTVFADSLDALHDAKARVVAFDINFPEPDENSALETLRQLKKAYHATGNVADPKFLAELDRRELGADTDKRLAEAISRFGNAILGYFFLFNKQEAASQKKEIVGGFMNFLSFQAYPQVIKPKKGVEFEGLEAVGVSPDLPQLGDPAKNFGFFNVLPDSDGTVRSEPIVIEFDKAYYPSLDIATILAYTNASLDKVAVVFNQGGLSRVDLGSVTVPTDPWGMVQIDFHGPTGTYPTYSIADVVQRKLSPELFRDKIVLLGPTATGLADLRPTPFESVGFPGVEVHANFIDNLLNGAFIKRGARENLLDMLFIFLFSMPVAVIISTMRPARSALLLVIAASAFVFFAYHEFAVQRVWLAMFLPMATLFVTYSTVVSYNYFFEEREKKAVRGAFQQYMAPEVIAQVLDRPELLRLGGEEKRLTAMFADIRGFTSLSEGLTPTALVDLLNEYLNEMTEIIFSHQGTLDKYIGDAIMAFWGAPLETPDHAERACSAALGMSVAMERLQDRWEKQGRPRIDIGIGINTGPMLVGNMGSERRFNYTIMGDDVNLASRLEGVTKQFGTRLIISQTTWEDVRTKMVTRELDLIRVKGKKKPVAIYQVLAPIEDRPRYADLVDRFEEALASYRGGDWAAARELFQALHTDYPNDGPIRTFNARCATFALEPPRGAWDGVYEMTTK
jgi:adenylate cyclase